VKSFAKALFLLLETKSEACIFLLQLCTLLCTLKPTESLIAEIEMMKRIIVKSVDDDDEQTMLVVIECWIMLMKTNASKVVGSGLLVEMMPLIGKRLAQF